MRAERFRGNCKQQNVGMPACKLGECRAEPASHRWQAIQPVLRQLCTGPRDSADGARRSSNWLQVVRSNLQGLRHVVARFEQVVARTDCGMNRLWRHQFRPSYWMGYGPCTLFHKKANRCTTTTSTTTRSTTTYTSTTSTTATPTGNHHTHHH